MGLDDAGATPTGRYGPIHFRASCSSCTRVTRKVQRDRARREGLIDTRTEPTDVRGAPSGSPPAPDTTRCIRPGGVCRPRRDEPSDGSSTCGSVPLLADPLTCPAESKPGACPRFRSTEVRASLPDPGSLSSCVREGQCGKRSSRVDARQVVGRLRQLVCSKLGANSLLTRENTRTTQAPSMPHGTASWQLSQVARDCASWRRHAWPACWSCPSPAARHCYQLHRRMRQTRADRPTCAASRSCCYRASWRPVPSALSGRRAVTSPMIESLPKPE